jgi:hypothetical protein
METKQKSVVGTINRVLLKAKYAFYCTLLYFLFANPYTYEVTNTYFGGIILESKGGQPTPLGFGIHLVFFFLTLTGLMLAPV